MKSQNLKVASRRFVLFLTAPVMVGMVLISTACNRTSTPPAEPAAQLSSIKVDVQHGGPVVLTTATAEFQVLSSGYVQAFLLKNGSKLTLDEPRLGTPTDSDYVVHDKKDVHFVLDFDQATVVEAIGKLGRGKHIEIPAHPLGPQELVFNRHC